MSDHNRFTLTVAAILSLLLATTILASATGVVYFNQYERTP